MDVEKETRKMLCPILCIGKAVPRKRADATWDDTRCDGSGCALWVTDYKLTELGCCGLKR